MWGRARPCSAGLNGTAQKSAEAPRSRACYLTQVVAMTRMPRKHQNLKFDKIVSLDLESLGYFYVFLLSDETTGNTSSIQQQVAI